MAWTDTRRVSISENQMVSNRSAGTTAPRASVTAAQQTETKRVKYGYQEMESNLIQADLNGPVKLQLKDGSVRASTLIGIEGNILQIRQKSGGGNMGRSLAKGDVAKLEVLTRVQ